MLHLTLQEAATAAGVTAAPAPFPSDERIAEVLYDIMGAADLNVSSFCAFCGAGSPPCTLLVLC